MRDSILDMTPKSAHDYCSLLVFRELTCCPSGLLSLPPFPVLRYGFFDSGWMQLSFSASIRSHTWSFVSADDLDFQIGFFWANRALRVLDIPASAYVLGIGCTHFLDFIRRDQRLEREHDNVNNPHFVNFHAQ